VEAGVVDPRTQRHGGASSANARLRDAGETQLLARQSRVAAKAAAKTPPQLAPSTERELVLAAQAGDTEARAALVELFTPLIASVARMYRWSPTVSRPELMQDGVVGLLRALERYDPAIGTPFWAYASWWVRQAMQQLVSELARPVVLSDRAARQLARIKGAQRSYLQAHRREPTTGQLAASTRLTRAQVENLIAVEKIPRPLEGTDDEGGCYGTLGELVADPRAEDAYECVPRRLASEDLGGLLSSLTHRERAIVRARFGLDGAKKTLRELGGQLGLSAERVRQIEQGALEKLRAEATTA
jgi:RNA polymerase primary sigma factor